MNQPIKVNYQYTSNAYTANQWLHNLPDLIACDLEVAIKYTSQQIEQMESKLSTNISDLQRINLESKLNATALDHPSHCTITHCQIAINDHEAYVFILDNKKINDLVLNFLVTTDKVQIWHRALFDFKHINYYTKKFPKNYEDTQLLAKTILNHTEPQKAKTSLKDLAGKWYGQWAISSDNFNLDQIYNKNVLLYAAIDACATYKLWISINKYIKETKNI